MAKLQQLSQDWLKQCWDYRPSGFWFWNDAMDPEAIETTIKEMAAKQVREFLIHPVHGMTLEYLSDEFFDRYRLTLRLAKEHNMKVWIYDEFGWPSGNVGGKLLEQHPEYAGWLLQVTKDQAGKTVVTPAKCDLVMDSCMGAPWTTSPKGHLNTLNADAVKCFIEMTHQRFYDELGELFNEVILGFFTDEPVVRMGYKTSTEQFWCTPALPWTPQLPGWFKERFGYDIQERFAELADAAPSKVKQDFWELVKEKYSDIYHGQIARWCQEHGVKYTGHVGEDSFLMQSRFSGSVYQCLSQMDLPGIDYLGGGYEPDERFAEEMSITSITRHSGREKTYCEAYGVSHFSLNLSLMLHEAELFAIHGINDIALMGFQQSQRGVRKHSYWPPIFREAPWWGFYPQFRDAFARSVGIASLGKRKAKYALLYPQNALEQLDLEISPWSANDLTDIINKIGLAVYAAGETFEFVFPEMLEQAKIVDGKIKYPYAEYEAIIACTDFEYFQASQATLDRIAADGGKVMREKLAAVETAIKAEPAAWAEMVNIEHDGKAGDIRIYQFDYEDGALFALRNVTEKPLNVTVSSEKALSQWIPVSGQIHQCRGKLKRNMNQHDTVYFTISDDSVGGQRQEPAEKTIAIKTAWTVSGETANLAAIDKIQFNHAKEGWMDAVLFHLPRESDGRRFNGVPNAFRGTTGAEFKGHFHCTDIPSSLGLVFERGMVESLTVNNQPVDLGKAKPQIVWDTSCVYVEISNLAAIGDNTVAGKLKWDRFETEMVNDAFFASGLMMPACDMFAAGDFKFVNGKITANKPDTLPAPLDLAAQGWPQYLGVVQLNSAIIVEPELAKRISALHVELLRDDAIELLLDGSSLGKSIMAPHTFDVKSIEPGQHKLTLRIASTSDGLVGDQQAWGIKTLNWITKA